MASVQKTMVFFLVMAALEASLAAVYKVGDSTGWTTLGNYNYTNWATTKNFLVGDTILFEYNKQFHNVMQVKHTAFRACNTSSPIATYSSGNDSITIRRTGHMYFLCGVPGHCQSGQKVDIRVPSLSAMAPTPSGSQAPSGSASSPPASQAPSGSGASPFGSQSPFGSATSPSGSQSPSGSATSPSPSGAMAPGPSQNSAPHPSNGLLGKAGLAVLALAVSISGFAY